MELWPGPNDKESARPSPAPIGEVAEASAGRPGRAVPPPVEPLAPGSTAAPAAAPAQDRAFPGESGLAGLPSPAAIKTFTSSPARPGAYAAFVRGIFTDTLRVPAADTVLNLLDHLEKETDFYLAPASTRYHGAEPQGLIRHSLLVLANGIELAPLMLKDGVDRYYLTVSCLFHDLCKTNMYETKLRNVKDEKTGEWRKEAFYTVRQDYISFGHGIESLLRLSKFITLPEPWKHAVRWHMGAYDISPTDKFALEKALAKYREVLFLQTADMRASVVDGV